MGSAGTGEVIMRFSECIQLVDVSPDEEIPRISVREGQIPSEPK